MINVVVFESSQGIDAFEISGHAESGPYGYDLVCAGVSAVSFGATNALMEVGGIEPEIRQSEDGGYLAVTIPSEVRDNDAVQIILKAMIVSLQTIEQEYHRFVQIKRK